MATYYVDTVSGDDTHAGTSFGTAYKTIAKAASVFANGDTILICATGTYTLTSTVTWTPPNTSAGFTSIQGADASGVVDGTMPTITTATNSTSLFTIIANTLGVGNLLFQYLNLTNTATTKAPLIVTTTTATNTFRITDCLLDMNATTGSVSCIDFTSRSPSSVTIARNTFRNFMGYAANIPNPAAAFVLYNTLLGATGCTGGILAASNSTSTVIGNSVNNCTIGLNINDSPHGGTVYWEANSFRGCTTAMKVILSSSATGKFINNAVWNSTTGISVTVTGSTAAQYTQWECIGNSFGNTTTNIDNASLPVYSTGPTITADPWPNATSGDFRAASGSAIRAAAWPTYPVGYSSILSGGDVGAVQHLDSAGNKSSVF